MKLEKEQTLVPEWIKAVEELKKIRVIRFKGDIDALAVARLEQFSVLTRQQKGYEFKHVLLDFSEVNSIDSATVAALLKALRDYKKTHQKLVHTELFLHRDEVFHEHLQRRRY